MSISINTNNRRQTRNNEVLAQAARAAAAVFRSQEWAWGSRGGSRIPDEADIALRLHVMVASLTPDVEIKGYVSTGRLMVMKMDSDSRHLYVEIGQIYDGEDDDE